MFFLRAMKHASRIRASRDRLLGPIITDSIAQEQDLPASGFLTQVGQLEIDREEPLEKHHYYRTEPDSWDDESSLEDTTRMEVPRVRTKEASPAPQANPKEKKPEPRRAKPARSVKEGEPARSLAEKPAKPSHRYLFFLLLVFLLTILYTVYLFRGFLGGGNVPRQSGSEEKKNFEFVEPSEESVEEENSIIIE